MGFVVGPTDPVPSKGPTQVTKFPVRRGGEGRDHQTVVGSVSFLVVIVSDLTQCPCPK